MLFEHQLTSMEMTFGLAMVTMFVMFTIIVLLFLHNGRKL